MRWILAIAGAIAISLIGARSVADDHVHAQPGEDWFDVSTDKSQDEQQSVVNSVESSVSRVTYSYEPVCVRGKGISRDDFYGCAGQQKCGEKGHMFYVWAHHSGGSSENLGSQCFEPDEAPVAPERQVTQAMVLRAFQRIPVPASRVEIQPPGGKTLVNLETIFSTEAAEFTRTIGLLGHRVDLEISPSRFEWVTGDGASFATDWAGRAWEKGVPMGEFITHNYDDADDVTTRVDTTWSAQYRVDGGDWQDVGGTVTIEGEPFDLAVLSAAPHLVS
jgi:hypothetical protein